MKTLQRESVLGNSTSLSGDKHAHKEWSKSTVGQRQRKLDAYQDQKTSPRRQRTPNENREEIPTTKKEIKKEGVLLSE